MRADDGAFLTDLAGGASQMLFSFAELAPISGFHVGEKLPQCAGGQQSAETEQRESPRTR